VHHFSYLRNNSSTDFNSLSNEKWNQYRGLHAAIHEGLPGVWGNTIISFNCTRKYFREHWELYLLLKGLTKKKEIRMEQGSKCEIVQRIKEKCYSPTRPLGSAHTNALFIFVSFCCIYSKSLTYPVLANNHSIFDTWLKVDSISWWISTWNQDLI